MNEEKKKPLEEKSIQEFRDTGLLYFVNHFLHIFGWCIVYDSEHNRLFPARTIFRGFDSRESEANAYIKLSKYMKDNAEEIDNDTNNY